MSACLSIYIQLTYSSFPVVSCYHVSWICIQLHCDDFDVVVELITCFYIGFLETYAVRSLRNRCFGQVLIIGWYFKKSSNSLCSKNHTTSLQHNLFSQPTDAVQLTLKEYWIIKTSQKVCGYNLISIKSSLLIILQWIFSFRIDLSLQNIFDDFADFTLNHSFFVHKIVKPKINYFVWFIGWSKWA